MEEAEREETDAAVSVIQAQLRRKKLRRALIAAQASVRAASFKRREQVLTQDKEEMNRRWHVTEANLVVLEEEAAVAADAAESHQRRSWIITIKRQDERNAKRLALDGQAQREALRMEYAEHYGKRAVEDVSFKRKESEEEDQAFAHLEAQQMKERQKVLKQSVVEQAHSEAQRFSAAAEEDYAIAGQRREDREGLAYLCKALSGDMHMVTAPGIAELWRVVDSDAESGDVQAVLREMKAKLTEVPKGTPKRGRRGSAVVSPRCDPHHIVIPGEISDRLLVFPGSIRAGNAADVERRRRGSELRR